MAILLPMASQPQPLSLALEVTEPDPPTGWVRAEGGARRPFGGWLELIGVLDAILGGDGIDQQASVPGQEAE